MVKLKEKKSRKTLFFIQGQTKVCFIK